MRAATLAAVNSLPARGRLPRGHVVLIPKSEPLRLASASRKPGKAQPARQAARVSTSVAKSYRVRGGDTVYRIALKHGTTVARLLALNSLVAPAIIRPGDTLRVPPKAR